MSHLSGQNLVNQPHHSSVQNPDQIPKIQICAEKIKSRQFWALVKIRFLIARRNKLVIFTRVVLPVIFIVIGAFLDRFVEQAVQRGSGTSSPSPLKMSAASYSYVQGEPSTATNPNTTLQGLDNGELEGDTLNCSRKPKITSVLCVHKVFFATE